MTHKKIMLIAGCSHTAGSEIDGSNDSKYNRDHSFGNILAGHMNYTPVNIAEPGSTNSTIARSVLQWFNEKYDASTMEVFVVIGWAESTRMEIPVNRISNYGMHFPFSDYHASEGRKYMRIIMGYAGANPKEKEFIATYHNFIAKNLEYLEIQNANQILQLQYFFKSISVNYLMCNTMCMFEEENKHIEFYLNLIDQRHYIGLHDPKNAFYWKYKNQGYENKKAKYFHHDEIPHRLYAEHLHNYITGKGLL